MNRGLYISGFIIIAIGAAMLVFRKQYHWIDLFAGPVIVTGSILIAKSRKSG